MENLESKDAIVCQLCREPIWNFLCIDCLSKNIEQWLPKTFSGQFMKFHTSVKTHFHTMVADNYEPCLDCSTMSETPICPYCYTHEVYHWMAALNTDMARNFSKVFFFYPFEGSEHLKSERGPIEEMHNKKFGFGMCDHCGEHSDSLEQSEGEWHCEVCKDG